MMKKNAQDTELLIQIGIAFFVLMAVIFKYHSYDSQTQITIEGKETPSPTDFEELQEAQARSLAEVSDADFMATLFDAKLDSQNSNDLEYENTRERDFLLNVVGVNREEYRVIQQRRRNARLQIRYAAEIAKENGMKPEQVKAAAVNNYIYFMQSMIGVGYYSQLQKVVNGTKEM